MASSEHYSNSSNSSLSPTSNYSKEFVSSSVNSLETTFSVSSPNTTNKIKKPRRLRKQINNDQFKQFYFEMKVNETQKKQEPQPSTSELYTNLPTVSESSSSSRFKQKESYEILQFETEKEKDEETLYQERIKNEIKANSHHFCITSKKKKKNASCQQNVNQETHQNCNHNFPTVNYQPPVNSNPIQYTRSHPILYAAPVSNPFELTQPVNNFGTDNNDLLMTILQLLLNNNK